MKNQFRKNHLKYVIFILLCMFLTYGSNCTGKTNNPPDPTCGIGNGECRFNAGYLPQTYNCNYEGSFGIDFYPDTNSSFDGFNRLWFDLEKNGLVYHSNYVEFNPNDPTMQQLEWGGSLNTGSYEVKGYIKNIQLNSTCLDSIFREYNHSLGYISISEFNNPTKIMNIEYFCQDSDTGIIDRYDVFLSPNTDKYINIAFNIANTYYSKITYQTDLPAILIDDASLVKRQYIYGLKQVSGEMFLCGIKGFKDTYGHLIIEELGSTMLGDTINFTPCNYSGSLVAFKTCINNAALQRYKIDYNDFVTAMVIHEVGHQRAIQYDYWGHNSKFCIMNQGLVIDDYVSRYNNPHFCNNCITKIKNINW